MHSRPRHILSKDDDFLLPPRLLVADSSWQLRHTLGVMQSTTGIHGLTLGLCHCAHGARVEDNISHVEAGEHSLTLRADSGHHNLRQFWLAVDAPIGTVYAL